LSNFTVDLSGQSAIVTGAGAGVGKAIASALARAGANVLVNDLNPDRGDNLVDELDGIKGNRVVANQGDVSNRYQAANMVEEARAAFGRIHILVNAAGSYKKDPMSKLDEWDWRRMLDVNLTGSFFASQLMGRVMSDEGGGVIINLTSSRNMADGIGYLAAKSGVVGMTQQAAKELAPANIRVNAVSIGDDISEEDMPHNDGQSGTVEQVANVVLFLCSSGAEAISGQVIAVGTG
jgi:3-oxoacyl-[acyl-carrier protein] reductase